MVEAVSKLLEVTPTKKVLPVRPGQNVNFTPQAQIDMGISREGWWMLSHYCTPTNKVRVRRCVCVYVCVCVCVSNIIDHSVIILATLLN